MRINNNMMAMNTHRQLGTANSSGAKSMEKLSSGFRINRAGDDAAGLSISEKMRGQIRGLNQASSNAQDGISLIQTAEGALNETHAILQRMRELAVQSASDTNVETDRNEIQKEMNQLTSEINRIGNTTEFNTMKLVNGDRAIEFEDKMVIADKNYDISSALGISGDLKGIDEITVGKTENFDWENIDGTADANKLTITKTAEGLTVDIVGADKTADPNTLAVTDKLTANDDGSFEYNAHGISFKVSAEDYALMADNDDLVVDLGVANGTVAAGADATGTIKTENSWTTNATGTAKIEGGIKINGSEMKDGAKSVKIEMTAADTYKVSILDAAGTAIGEDKISSKQALDYNNHGISFKLDVGAETALELTIDLEEIQGKGAVKSDDSLSFQVGANENQSMSLDIGDMRASALGISSGDKGEGFIAGKAVTDGTDNTAAEYSLDVSSHKSAAASVTTINNAIEMVSAERSKLGAVQNRLEHTIKNLDTSSENLQASESRIRDVDMAKEMMEQTKANILAQASTAMLANANQSPQSVLQLLG